MDMWTADAVPAHPATFCSVGRGSRGKRSEVQLGAYTSYTDLRVDLIRLVPQAAVNNVLGHHS
jgi:hypothetical protein